MRSYMVPPGIRFNGWLFSEPVPLATWQQPGFAGIVAILVRNPQWAPQPVLPLLFGDFGNGTPPPPRLPEHARRADLLISVLPMPFSTVTQRRAIVNQLIVAYHPVCQTGSGIVSTGEMARKVDELEARQHEQAQQILALLGYIAKLFEPQPVGRRKPIGFLAQLAPAAAPKIES